jgi:hypothetical protein
MTYNPETRHRKFMGYYRMSLETFNNLLLELTLFFQSHCVPYSTTSRNKKNCSHCDL